MTIQQDELFKATAHGLLLGSVLPILFYNLKVKNGRNLSIYIPFLAFEMYHIVDHIMNSQRPLCEPKQDCW